MEPACSEAFVMPEYRRWILIQAKHLRSRAECEAWRDGPLPEPKSLTHVEWRLALKQLTIKADLGVDVRIETWSSSVCPPSAFPLELCVPMALTKDFVANLTEIYEDSWVPKYGQKRANLLWHRQCLGLIARHWFDVFVSAAERLRKVIYTWG